MNTNQQNIPDRGLALAPWILVLIGGAYSAYKITDLKKSLNKLNASYDEARRLLSDANLRAEELEKELQALTDLKDALEKFKSASDSVSETVMGALCHTHNFDELRPFGGMKPMYGVATSDSAGLLFFNGPMRCLGVLTSYIEQLILAREADESYKDLIVSRQLFDDNVLPYVRGCFYGARLFSTKENWPTLRRAVHDRSLVGILRRWDFINGITTGPGGDDVSGVKAIGPLQDWDAALAELHGARPEGTLLFERLHTTCERGRAVFGTIGSNDWLYTSPTWWAFLDALRRVASGPEPYLDKTVLEAVKTLTPREIYLAMPTFMQRVADTIGFGMPDEFAYAVHNTTIPTAVAGFSYKVYPGRPNFEGTAVALRELLKTEFNVEFRNIKKSNLAFMKSQGNVIN